MSTYNSAEITTANIAKIGYNTMNTPLDTGGIVKQAVGTYTTTGSETSGDTINLVQIPNGSRLSVQETNLYVQASTGSTGTINLNLGSTALATGISASGGAYGSPVSIGTINTAAVTADLLVQNNTTYIATTLASTGALGTGKIIRASVNYVS